MSNSENIIGYSSDDIVGYVCSKCKANIKYEDIKITGHTEYEGMDVSIFDCPTCGKSVDDLQCDFWIIASNNIKIIEKGE